MLENEQLIPRASTFLTLKKSSSSVGTDLPNTMSADDASQQPDSWLTIRQSQLDSQGMSSLSQHEPS